MNFSTVTWIVGGLALFGIVVVLLLALVIARLRREHRRAEALQQAEEERQAQRVARAAAAKAGEANAEEVLTAAGYEVISRQHPEQAIIRIDGQETRFALRIDLIVRKDGLTYIADVKTGSVATSPRHGATRRQLLEYMLVFQAAGALLVDMDSRAIHSLEFVNYGVGALTLPSPVPSEPTPPAYTCEAETAAAPVLEPSTPGPRSPWPYIALGAAVGFTLGAVLWSQS